MKKKIIIGVLLISFLLSKISFATPIAITNVDNLNEIVGNNEKGKLLSEVIASGTCGSHATWSINSEGVLYINGSGELYSFYYSGTPWKDYTAIIKKIIVSKHITNIEEGTFKNCNAVEALVIPFVGTKRGDYGVIGSFFGGTPFYHPELNQVTQGSYYYNIPKSLCSVTVLDETHIPNNAFVNCKNICNIDISKTVTTIGKNAFENCFGLRSLEIPNTVTSIGDYAFENCKYLESIVIPQSVTTIGTEIFYNTSLNLKIYGYKDSFIEEYVKDNSLDFHIIGDINEDENIDMNDAILLLQHSMFPAIYPIEYLPSVDFTSDENIDMNDAILLLQHSMFPNLYPLE